MNIVFVTTELAAANNASGGLATFTANIAKIFARNGHQVSIVLASTQEVQIEFEENISIFSLYIPMKKWIRMDKVSKAVCKLSKNLDKKNEDDIRRTIMNLYKARQVKKVIKEINEREKIDIIHYCNHGSFSRISMRNIPYIIRISGFENIVAGGSNIPNGSVKYEDNPLLLVDRLEKCAIRRSRHVMCPSYLLARIVKENYGMDATVIESPFVLNRENWDYTVIDDYSLREKKYIIHYGYLRYGKGTHLVAQLVENLLRAYPNIYLVLAGKEAVMFENGCEIGAAELVKKNAGEFSDRVYYVGRLVREQLYPFIQNAELCLLPSRIENLSNACIEAMAMGKIVVATNGASYEQLIEDGVSGFLCERDNPESYFNAIIEVLKMSEEEKRQMGLKAQKVTERLNPQTIYNQFLEYYEKVIKEW